MINMLRIRLKKSVWKIGDAQDVGRDGEPTHIEAAQTNNHSLTSGKKNQTKEQTTQKAQANSFY